MFVYDSPLDRSCYSLNTAHEMIRVVRVRLDELEGQLVMASQNF
jgi:hypothetical protein